MSIIKATKKPVAIEAIQLKDSNIREVHEFIYGPVAINSDIAADKWLDYKDIILRDGLAISTPEGVITASIGDYIIKDVNGEFYPCKPDIFHKTYDIGE